MARARPRVTAPRVAVALAAVLVVGWYVTALQLGSGPHTGASAATAYNRMADAFVHGRVDLGRAPHALTALPNPYDPAANETFRDRGLHDLSLYHGRIYAYWGPVPAVLLYVPAHLAGQVLNDGWVVLLFCLGSFAVAVATLLVLRGRWEATTRPSMLFFAVLALGVANMAAHLLSRPTQYEVAIAAGTFFVLCSVLLFLLGGLDGDRPRPWLIAGASVCAGLAAGSRATCGLVIALGVVLLVERARQRRPERGELMRLGGLVVAPFAVIVALLLAYNAARFGTPFEFGRRWQLTVVDLSSHSALDLRVVLPTLWNYLVPPPLLRAQFPFWFGNPGITYPISLPSSYISGDAVIGVWALAPITLLLLTIPWVAGGTAGRARRPVVLLAGVGTVLLLPLLFLRGAPAAVRYEADFLPAWTLAAVLLWLTARGRSARVLGALAVAWSVMVLAGSSLDNDQVLSELHPATFRKLEDAFSPVASTMTAIAGHPVIAKVDSQAAGPPYRYAAIGVDGASVAVGRQPVEVRIVSPGDRTSRLEATVSRGAVAVGLRGQRGRLAGPGRHGVALRLRRGVNIVRLAAPGARPVRLANLRLRAPS